MKRNMVQYVESLTAEETWELLELCWEYLPSDQQEEFLQKHQEDTGE